MPYICFVGIFKNFTAKTEINPAWIFLYYIYLIYMDIIYLARLCRLMSKYSGCPLRHTDLSELDKQ